MYAKVMNVNAASLKELWRWVKGIGQMLHRLKKWRKNCR
jgi:DNA uptake protein ComE-like DNA-binding protein